MHPAICLRGLTWTRVADGAVVFRIDTPNTGLPFVALKNDRALGRNAVVTLLDVKRLDSGGVRRGPHAHRYRLAGGKRVSIDHHVAQITCALL